MTRSLQWVVIGLLTTISTISMFAAWRMDSTTAALQQDFATFYCAGAATNAGGNAYLWKDLDACGNLVVTPKYAEAHRPPAPIPGYDIAFFQVIANVPYNKASLVWLIVSAAAFLTAVFYLSLITEFPPLIVFAAFMLPLRNCIALGQFIPFLMAALSYTAYAVKRERYTSAAIAAATMLVEPHLGLPVCIAMYCWLPKTRRAFEASAAILITASLESVGVRGNVDFFRTVLPLHMAAEAPFSIQYSLTWLLYFAGVPEALAIKLGSLCYYASVATSVYVTRKLPHNFVPVVPAAIVVLGGPFIHDTQISIATIAALMLAATYNNVRAWLAVVILAMVWANFAWSHQAYNATRIACCLTMGLLVGYALRAHGWPVRLSISAAAVAIYFALSLLFLRMPDMLVRYPDLADYAASTSAFREYTNVPWGDNAHRGFSSLYDLLRKIPLWFGLALVIYESISRAKRVPA